jgi:hypothetical protein
MATENTHMAVVAGAGQTAAGQATIGTLTLPAGGPWIIHHIFGTVARATATAGELNGGQFRIETVSGDIKPQPSPSWFPLIESGSSLGATIDQSVCPLHLYEVNYEGAGKAVFNLIYRQETAVTAAPQLVLGVAFGKTRPVKVPMICSDVVRAQVTSAADTAIGTITLAESASKITGIYCVATQDNVLTTGEELTGFCRLASDDIDFTPMQIPLSNAYGAGLGALINNAPALNHDYIPVDIPVLGGARVNCFVDLNTAVTNAAEVAVFIAYE